MRLIIPGYLHSDNDIGIRKRLGTPDFSWPDSVHKKKKKKILLREVEKFKTFKLN